ncbi:MAG TPA: DUF3103 family protein [Micromonosporaceae bacterium]|nr:DUF3103 family protein [Micromonosporaceae bacterium]
MNRRAFHLSALSLGAVTVTLVATAATPVSAWTGESQRATSAVAAPAGSVSATTDGLARQLAGTFTDRAVQRRVAAAVADAPADLATIEAGPAFAASLRSANQAVLAAKGLPATAGSMLQLRLGHPDMRAALARGEAPLVAAAPTDDTVTSVVAYTPKGRPVRIDGTRIPRVPVLVVEVNTAKALPLGLQVMRDMLARRGLAGADGDFSTNGGYWATKVNAIRLSNDCEPWIKGAAEIFDIVGGFGFDSHVRVDIVQMPYLDHDNTTYYPNQLIVHYFRYKYNLADVVMMEDDGDTNYQALATAIINALLTIIDGGMYIPLVNAILNAIPTSWWTDDPDYVESWYTLATTSSGRLYGASANGWMDVVPYWVPEL